MSEVSFRTRPRARSEQIRSWRSDLIHPLDANEHVIALLARVTGEPRATVGERLLKEHENVGCNVRQSLADQEIEPWASSPAHQSFYETTDAFLYEMVVWNRYSAKRQMRRWIGRYLTQQKSTRRILVYGDGVGADSAYLATLGFDVTFYEPSLLARAFARELFQDNDLAVSIVDETSELPAASFDAIVCLDVLEHLSDPKAVLRQFGQWLTPNGRLLVHAPFYLIDTARPTHLASNRRYSGSTQLFSEAGFRVINGQPFWNPLVLTQNREARRSFGTVSIRLMQPILTTGRLSGFVGWAANQLAARPTEWTQELRRYLASRSSNTLSENGSTRTS